ncbi:unnamed protein product [Pleuronectes platessa]|uniref:Uncharacterized protein n=1 Tax=Pleuronectes platessa TaxID=8262 RepID=A0A9N7TZD2_PLEPL|nr:unnamed protein product [Pleuronectes platessa]
MQMGQTGDRTANLQVGGRPVYPSATARAHIAKWTKLQSFPPPCNWAMPIACAPHAKLVSLRGIRSGVDEEDAPESEIRHLGSTLDLLDPLMDSPLMLDYEEEVESDGKDCMVSDGDDEDYESCFVPSAQALSSPSPAKGSVGTITPQPSGDMHDVCKRAAERLKIPWPAVVAAGRNYPKLKGLRDNFSWCSWISWRKLPPHGSKTLTPAKPPFMVRLPLILKGWTSMLWPTCLPWSPWWQLTFIHGCQLPHPGPPHSPRKPIASNLP